jgi:hypothetical protein
MFRLPLLAAAALLAVAASAPALAQIRSAPPLPGAAERAAPKRVELLRTDDGAPAHAIALAAPTVADLESLKSTRGGKGAKAPTAQGKRVPLKIGIVRDIDRRTSAIDTVALPWQSLADGSKAARIVVRSASAAAVRMGLALRNASAGVSVRFVGSAHPEDVFGPFPATDLAATELYWSPVLEGETGTMEIVVPAGVAPESIELSLVKVGHMVVAGAALRDTALKWTVTGGIGGSGACEIDVACEAPTAAVTAAASSIALTVTTDARFVYQCTATLVNDSIGSRTPNLFTANHCLASDRDASPRSTPAQLAASMNSYWFFDAPTCGNRATPAYTLVAGGAALLGRSDDYDWALLRMKAPPPASAGFSAWRAETLSSGAAITAIHHPSGDLKKISHGALSGYTPYDDGSSFATVRFTSGVTEPGSSGSPLLTLSGQGFYEVRGGLYGGDSSCSNPAGADDYSRLDIALPKIAQYLTPNAANPAGISPVVEYYHAGLNDYFVTADPGEINCLDTGCLLGWERTGLRFLAYTNPALAPADAMPVCRFYVLPAFGDSHFYSADPAECAQTAADNKGSWLQESSAVFYIRLPNKATGACPANTEPVYRFVNVATPLHHRYTAEVDVRNCLAEGMDSPSLITDLNCTVTGSNVWLQEGYGTPLDAPVMCAPRSN